MTPTWQSDDGSVVLYCADCLAVLPELTGIDAVVTDPPYGIGHPCHYAKRGRGKLARCNDWKDVHGDNKPFDPMPFLSLSAPTIMWGGNWYADKLPASGGWLVWDKDRPDDLDQATCELAWSNCVKGVRRMRHLWHGMMRASEHGPLLHATQKPIAVMAWCLQWIAKGATVLDPFMGSGTTGVACIRTGRRFVGIEIDPHYFEVARARLERELAQPMLLPPETKRPEQPELIAEGACIAARQVVR